jgi:predicted acylesterase/phospholipase RssA
MVLSSWNLATAMRASMYIPNVALVPAELDGKLPVGGGGVYKKYTVECRRELRHPNAVVTVDNGRTAGACWRADPVLSIAN